MKKTLLATFVILSWISIFAENEILSLVCVKSIGTIPGEPANLVCYESLNNVVCDLLRGELAKPDPSPKKVLSALSEYQDRKIFRIEYGTSIQTRNKLRQDYGQLLDKIDKVATAIQNPKEIQDYTELRNLRVFSYQTLTRKNLLSGNEKNLVPFGIESYDEAYSQLLNAKPFIYGKTLDLLQFSGGWGNFYRGMPVMLAGLQITELLNLCIILNNKIKGKIFSSDGGLLNDFKKSCSLINATVDAEWQNQKLTQIIETTSGSTKVEKEFKTLGGITKQIFQESRSDLDDFKNTPVDDLKLTFKNIYLNTAWSAGVIPIFEPILQNKGLMIGVISAPNDNDSSTDITDKLYSKDTIESGSFIESFFKWYKSSSMLNPNTNSGFCPYIILKKKPNGLVVHYFLDPQINDFVLGFDSRNESKPEDLVPMTNFPGLQNFNEKYNKEADDLVERVYIWHCCWHAPVTDDVIKQATNEALKTKSLLTFLQKSNISIKAHESFDEFKTSALNLFE